ncbi:MAG TPA: response regulator [Pyrinomonadaceae bacterium]|nr:response regulator [Pyrinomonadaceae bacterium]
MKLTNRLRVLYAENNEDACFMLSKLLEFSGVEVSCAHTFKQAFDEARSKSFDVYLLGSKFSDGSDLELCRRLREFSPQIPIVFYSNDAREIDRQKGLATGAQAYLIKPEIDTVLPTILRLASQVSDSQMPVKASTKGQNRNRKIASAQKSDTF